MSTSEDTFITPVSSMDDLMAMSPRNSHHTSEQFESIDDLLTGSEFSSICDVTMRETTGYDDIFVDATGLDFLVKCTESNRNNITIDRGKESLFVKFDPLYAGRKIEQCISAQNESKDYTDIGYETGSAASIINDSHISATPTHSLSSGSMPGTNTKDKPMQVVPPVVNDITKTTYQRPPPPLVRSVSAILSGSQVATDRLINIAGDTPPTAAPRSPRFMQYTSRNMEHFQSLRTILEKQEEEMLQLRQENRELKSSLKEVQHRQGRSKEDMEAKLKKLNEEKENMLEREMKLIQQINDKILSNKQMSIVMEEYEKTISSLISEQQRDKIMSQETIEKLTLERDQALDHLSSMESSFNDLLAKYEKCKCVILESKEREKVFEQKIIECEEGMKKYEDLYKKLKQVTSENLQKANETLDTVQRKHSIETKKLNATIKKNEISILSLQESLTQKIKHNEELTKICDQLLNDVR